MKWLAETVKARGMNPGAPEDPWWYKGEYNRRLMENVGKRVESVKSGLVPRENYMIRGSEAFLKALKARGVKLYVASGTDHPDVMNEVAALGLSEYFTFIAGAPVAAESCSKEKVIADLMENEGLSGADFAVIGDGKVEIRLGAEAGARTVGLASDEEHLCGVNPVKRERLIRAGADVICGDFGELGELGEVAVGRDVSSAARRRASANRRRKRSRAASFGDVNSIRGANAILKPATPPFSETASSKVGERRATSRTT
jgi:phosphoglycolate phosphatase-like HAD superfamily hydrolase